MRSICLLVLFVAIAAAAVPRGHPAVLTRPATRTKSAPRVPPTNGNGRDTNGNGPNGNGKGPNGNGWNGVVTDFLQLFKQAPPNVQREIVTMFNQIMPPAAPPAPPAAPPAVPVAPAPVAPAVAPARVAPAVADVPPQPAVAAAPPMAAPARPPTVLKSAPRPAYTYQGRPALFNPQELYNPAPVGQYPAPLPPAQPAQPAQPAFDFLQFYHLFTDAPEVKKNGKYIEP